MQAQLKYINTAASVCVCIHTELTRVRGQTRTCVSVRVCACVRECVCVFLLVDAFKRQ